MFEEVGQDTQLGDELGNEQFVPSTMDMLRNKVIRTNLIVITFSFVSSVFNFYMIGFYMKYIKGEFYLNSILSGIATVISIIIVNPV